jgi:hypothetical protein
MLTPPTVDKMTPGQLKLHFAAVCQRHQCNGVNALGYASKVPPDRLRTALLHYEVWARKKNWQKAEDALLSIVAAAQAVGPCV